MMRPDHPLLVARAPTTLYSWLLRDEDARAPRWTAALAIRLGNRLARDCVERRLRPLFEFPTTLRRIDAPGFERAIYASVMARCALANVALEATRDWWIERFLLRFEIEEAGL